MALTVEVLYVMSCVLLLDTDLGSRTGAGGEEILASLSQTEEPSVVK